MNCFSSLPKSKTSSICFHIKIIEYHRNGVYLLRDEMEGVNNNNNNNLYIALSTPTILRRFSLEKHNIETRYG